MTPSLRIGTTMGSTAVQAPSGTAREGNEYGGEPALSALIAWSRDNIL